MDEGKTSRECLVSRFAFAVRPRTRPPQTTKDLKRLCRMVLLGAWLSIFAGNAAAECEIVDSTPPRLVCRTPSVSLTSPTNGTTYPLATPFSVTATVDNGGQPITGVAFFVNNTLIQTFTTGPYSLTYTPPTPGTYTFKATATETNPGTRTGTSSLVSVTVNPGIPNAPSGLGAAAGASNVNLTWSDNDSYETGFKIERKIGA